MMCDTYVTLRTLKRDLSTTCDTRMFNICLISTYVKNMWHILLCIIKKKKQILGRNYVQIYQTRACTLLTNYNINAKYNANIYHIRRF